MEKRAAGANAGKSSGKMPVAKKPAASSQKQPASQNLDQTIAEEPKKASANAVQEVTQEFTENDLQQQKGANLDATVAQADLGAKSGQTLANQDATQEFAGMENADTGSQNRDMTQEFTQPGGSPAAAKTRKPGKPGMSQTQTIGGNVSQKINMLGDYRLIKKLGAGGMGTVYKAHQQSLDREVAVKILPKRLAENPTLVQRFLREARVMAKLDHPNILRCYDVGEVNGFNYLAAEYIDGGSLHDYIEKLGKLSIGDAVHVIMACASGLGHAHEQNMIHRDIKPENILLTRKGVVKVADLGLAKALDEDLSLTKTGTGAGTPLYMSPEQARSVKHVDHRSDIYSLGCMLYRMLAGEVPFKGETLVDVISAKEVGKFKATRKFNEEIPAKLDLIIDKLLATKPEHRYQSCAELVKALSELDLANDTLSFIESAQPQSTGQMAKTMTPQKAAATMQAFDAPVIPDREEKLAALNWYVELELPDGRTLTRKVAKDRLANLVKKGAVTNQTLACRSYKGKYSPLSTFSDFSPLFMAKAAQDKANKKGSKFRDVYEEIEEDEKRKKSKMWWKERRGLIIALVLIVLVVGGGAAAALMFLQ